MKVQIKEVVDDWNIEQKRKNSFMLELKRECGENGKSNGRWDSQTRVCVEGKKNSDARHIDIQHPFVNGVNIKTDSGPSIKPVMKEDYLQVDVDCTGVSDHFKIY